MRKLFKIDMIKFKYSGRKTKQKENLTEKR